MPPGSATAARPERNLIIRKSIDSSHIIGSLGCNDMEKCTQSVHPPPSPLPGCSIVSTQDDILSCPRIQPSVHRSATRQPSTPSARQSGRIRPAHPASPPHDLNHNIIFGLRFSTGLRVVIYVDLNLSSQPQNREFQGISLLGEKQAKRRAATAPT